jgi:hypothetical protein
LRFDYQNEFKVYPHAFGDIQQGWSGNPYLLFDLGLGLNSPDYGELYIIVRNFLTFRDKSGEIKIIVPRSFISSRRKSTGYHGIILSTNLYSQLQKMIETKFGKVLTTWKSKERRKNTDDPEEVLQRWIESQKEKDDVPETS